MIQECEIAVLTKIKHEELRDEAEINNYDLNIDYYYKIDYNNREITHEGSPESLEALIFALRINQSGNINQIKIEDNKNKDIILFYKSVNDSIYILSEKVDRTYPSSGATGYEEELINKFIDFTKNSKEIALRNCEFTNETKLKDCENHIKNKISTYLIKEMLSRNQDKVFLKRIMNHEEANNYDKCWNFYLFDEAGSPFLFPTLMDDKTSLAPSCYYINGKPEKKTDTLISEEVKTLEINESYADYLGGLVKAFDIYLYQNKGYKIKHLTLDDRIIMIDEVLNKTIWMEVINKDKKNGEYKPILIGNERTAGIAEFKKELESDPESLNRDPMKLYEEGCDRKKLINEWKNQSMDLQIRIDKRIAKIFERI